ncbi:sugar phosphate isomerase/epimerase family protein [Microbacterium ulmi]|uniref:Sugar phosphate isomerase/epimerase n=1 Tax=Microbacterium ulmi TaxID=179095 RepID=A0A7Y2Q2G3_9MICO|nr:sugar phosphate isomerase/epimerase family protein [Microbacterium ulmi]NII68592.1 sugar phosphate isomerase/epimerase [Microbacterium ulmi]NNH05035.1 sugar phosphate isomerase/epimerase [Microbacterium ulmi]
MSPDRFTARTWPIAAATLYFAGPGALDVHAAPAEEWDAVFADIARAGFDHVDLTDGWLRPADLDAERHEELLAAAHGRGLGLASVSAIRRSVIDRAHGDDNLAYSHRTLDAATALGIRTVSFGLHQALTPQQKERLWFWTAQGHVDDPADWELAVVRLRELGRHAEELGILMSLEMYEDTFLGTADSAVRLVEDIGLDSVGLNPDIGNLVRLHRPIEDWRELVEKTAPYTNFWHVKNYARDENPDRDHYAAFPTTMEAGLIDYRWAVRHAISQGFQGVICTENYGGDGLGVCAANRDYLRRQVLPLDAGYASAPSRVRQLSDARTREGTR